MGRVFKARRLENKIAKIKRQINLEFETEALRELNDVMEWQKNFDVNSGFQIADCFYQLR